MKTKLFLLPLSCFVILSFAAYAQPPQMPSGAQMRQSPVIQQVMKAGVKTSLRSFWDGKGSNLMFVGMLSDAEARAALGMSDEVFQQIQGAAAPNMQNPEMQKLLEEMTALRDPNDVFMQNADEEKINQVLDIQTRMSSLVRDTMSEAIDNALSPEMKQHMQEAQLAIMGEMPIVSPSIFEALDLSDAQKQQMETIKKELEPEFEKNLNTLADGSVVIASKMFEEIEKQGGYGQNANEMQARMQAVQKKLQEDPEFKKVNEELQTVGKAFAIQFKTKMFDVLTDDQWKRLQELTDNPPEVAKVFLKKLKEQRGESERTGGGWQPSPDSWKPGDAIPEAYRQERNTRGNFPRAE